MPLLCAAMMDTARRFGAAEAFLLYGDLLETTDPSLEHAGAPTCGGTSFEIAFDDSFTKQGQWPGVFHKASFPCLSD